MAGSRKKKAQSLVGLDTTFYRELLRFYRDNRGSIRSHQMLLNVSMLGIDRIVEILAMIYNA